MDIETSKTAAPELDLDELMERIRGEVAERKKLSEGSARAPTARDTSLDFAARRWTARELLTLPAPAFWSAFTFNDRRVPMRGRRHCGRLERW